MPVNHVCSDKCFAKRTAAKIITKCRNCDMQCNLMCYGTSSDYPKNGIDKNSNFNFVCTKCFNSLFLSKNRRSSVTDNRAAPSVDGSSSSTNNKSNDTARNSNSNQLEFSTAVISILDRLNEIENNMSTNMNKMHQSLEQTVNKDTATENFDSLLREILKASHTLSKVATHEHLKDSVANICTSIDKRMPDKVNDSISEISSNKPHALLKSLMTNNIDSRHSLDFSFSVLNDSANATESNSGRQSIIVQQNIDDGILEIVKNAEETTWKSLDILNAEIKCQSERLIDIQNTIKLIAPVNVPVASQSRSPLTESIIHDNIDKILNEVTYLNNKSTLFYDNFSSMIKSSSPPSLSLNMPQNNADNDAIVNLNHNTTNQLEHQVFDILESIENDDGNSSFVTPPTDYSTHAGMIKTISNIGSSLSETTPSQADKTLSLNDELALSASLDATTTSLSVMSPPNEVSHAGIDSSTAYPNETQRTVILNREFHVTKFNPAITPLQIKDYIVKKIDCNSCDIRVFRLTKKNQDLTKLKYVNFKIETLDYVANIISEQSFWPLHCSISPFIRKGVCNLDLLAQTRNNRSSMLTCDFDRQQQTATSGNVSSALDISSSSSFLDHRQAANLPRTIPKMPM